MRRDLSALAPAVAAGMLVLVFFSLRLPPPRGEDAAPGQFSAARARRLLDTLTGNGAPRPSGSAQSASAGGAIVAELSRLGYEAVVEESFICGTNLACAEVRNIIGRPRGSAGTPGVFLVSHYDSVPASPGASDDLSGVAVSLEVLRVLGEERHTHPVSVLITDGEEAGLLGAEAFARESRFAPLASAVINLEARGTSGESHLFETSDDNAWLVSTVIRALPRPSTSSLFYAVYERLPNDTDFTVLKRRGIDGVNFAFIGSPLHYHTPLDTPAALSEKTLQHHGENALAAARALSEAGLQKPPPGNAVWFSVFARFVISWPEPWTLPLSAANLTLLGVAVFRLMRAREARVGGLIAGIIWCLASILAPALLAHAAVRLLALFFGERAWMANMGPLLLFTWLASFSTVAFLAAVRANRIPPVAYLSGTAVVFAGLSVASGFIAPGVSFLVLVPGAGLSAALLSRSFGGPLALGQAGAAAVASVVLFPLAWMLPDALGLPSMPGVALAVALVSAVVVPSFATGDVKRLQFLALLVLGAVASLLAAFFVPAETENAPAPVNIVHRQIGGRSEWLVAKEALRGREELGNAASWEPAPVPLYPWSKSASHLAAKAAGTGEEPPRVELSSESEPGGDRVVSLRFVSARKAPRLRVALSDGGALRSVSVAGEALELRPGKRGAWLVFRHVTLPAEGVLVTIRVPKGEKVTGYALDESSGLPSGGEVLAGARGPRAVPVHDGDRSLAVSEFSF